MTPYGSTSAHRQAGQRGASRLSLVILIAALVGSAAVVYVSRQRDVTTATGPLVEVYVDGAPLARVDASAIGERLLLTEVVPPAKRDVAGWAKLDVHTREERRKLSFQRPATRFPDQDFALYVSKQGAPSFGVYRRDSPSLHPRLRELLWQPAPYLEDVVRITIRTAETADEARARKLRGTLEIAVDGADAVAITTQMLDSVEAIEAPPAQSSTAPAPGALRGRPGLWWLRHVLTLVVKPESVRAMRLVDIEGKSHELAVTALSPDAKTRAALKRNRRDDHHVRLLEGERMAAKIRSVVRIEVDTR